jgi:hypothetical protein
MNISKPNNIHRIYYDAKKVGPKHALKMRATLGERFKILLLDAGLTPEQAGKELHVTPRTIRYWISGKVLVPYAAFRLIRILRMYELPQPGWDGWHMHSGRLWSPEGHAFLPHDANWWSLLVRRADGFGRQYDRANQLAVALQRLAPASDAMTATNETAPAGALGTGLAVPEKEGKPVTPSFFSVPRNFSANCYKFKPSVSAGFGGAV